MPCPSQTFTGEQLQNIERETFSRRRTFAYSQYFRPKSLQEIVFVAAAAHSQGRKLHAVGSLWAYEELCASDDWGISLECLKADLTRRDSPDSVVNQATLLPQLWADLESGNRPTVAQFQGGAKVSDVAEDLEKRNYALPTIGGANVQTFIGAASTSTHGGDFDGRPLPDLIRALHIVAPDGHELWIESATRPVTEPGALPQALSCPDVKVFRDDLLLQAAIVSFGRMGVVHSFVIDVVPAFNTVEVSVRLPRENVLLALTTQDNPFSQWSGVIRANQAASGLNSDDQALINSRDADFVQFLTPSHSGTDCVLTGRWHVRVAVDALNDVPHDPLMDAICNPGLKPVAIAALDATFLTAIAAAGATPVIGPVLAAQLVLAQTQWHLRIASSPHIGTGAEVLVAALRECWHLPFSSELISRINEGIVLGRFTPSISEGRRGKHWLLTSGEPSTTEEQCFRGDSQELIFPSDRQGFIQFVKDVLNEGGNHRQVGYVSMRCSRTSEALLSMHDMSPAQPGSPPAPYAVSIEVSSISEVGDYKGDYLPWMRLVQNKALALGGRPHWGQQHELTAGDVDMLYGERIGLWTGALKRLGGEAQTFSNVFTRARGLEPLEHLSSVATIAFRDPASGSVLVSVRGRAPINTGARIIAGTHPTIVSLAAGECLIAFRGPNGNLWVYESANNRARDLGHRLMLQASPAASASKRLLGFPEEVSFAFASDNATLCVGTLNGGIVDTGSPMFPATRPGIASRGLSLLPSRVAFHSRGGTLVLTGGASFNGFVDTGILLAFGCSPALCRIDEDTCVVAYVSSQGRLCVMCDRQGAAVVDTGIEVKPGTSPAVASKSRNQFMAVCQDANGTLAAFGPRLGVVRTALQMADRNSPSVCALPGRFGVVCTTVDETLALTETALLTQGGVEITATLVASDSNPVIG